MHEQAFPIGNLLPTVLQKDFSNCLSHYSPAKGWPHRFRSWGTTGSSILDHDLGHLCRGRRIQMSGHSFQNFGCIFLFTWVSADTAPAACPAQPGSLEMISMTLAAVICDADVPCSVTIVHKTQNRLYNITSECNSTLVFLVLCLQISVFLMTCVH